MTVMNREIYEALKAANISDEKAIKAAESVAAFDKETVSIRSDLADMTSDLRLLKWMIGFNLAVSLAMLWKLIS